MELYAGPFTRLSLAKIRLFAAFVIVLFQAIPNLSSAQDTTGLVAYWPFPCCSLTDATGHGHNGTLTNAPICVPGIWNQGYQFSGDNSIDVPFSTAFDIPGDSALTLSAWVKPTNVNGAYQALVIKGSAVWDYGLYIDISGSFMFGSNWPNHETFSVTKPQNGVWYSVTGVYSNGDWKLFINGRLEDQITNGAPVGRSTHGISFGKKGDQFTDEFTGVLDEIRMYNRALTDSEVLSLYSYVDARRFDSSGSLSLQAITQQFNASACLPKDTVIRLGDSGCSAGTLDSLWLVGSQSIRITDTRRVPRLLGSSDSIVMQYMPIDSGKDTSVLHIRYDLGSGPLDTTITIIGTNSHSPGTFTLLHPTQSVLDTTCKPKDTAFRLGGTGCPGVTLERITLTGSSAFTIGDARSLPRSLDSLDSVRIVFTPTPPGIDTTYVHLQYNTGSGSRDTILTLIGSSRNTSNTFSLSPTTQSVFQAICSTKDTSYKLGGTGCPGVTLVSAFMSGSSAFTIGDARKTPRTLDSLDSVRIVYSPTPPGVDTSYLHLVYTTGSGNRDTVITLIGTLDPSLRTVQLETSASPEIVQATCIPIPIPTPLWVTGCIASGGRLDSVWLTGSPAIQISDARRVPRLMGLFDSIRLQYMPGTTAPDTALLHLRYDLGEGPHDTTITVIGNIINPLPPPAILIPSSIESILSRSCGGSDTSLRIGVTGCPLQNGELDSVWLSGSSTIRITDARSVPRSLEIDDSLDIQFAPTGGNSDTAELHIRYNVGSGAQDTILTVIGSVASPLLAQSARMHRESASAYYGGIDSLPLQLDLTTAINFDSLWNLITDIQGTCAFDGSVVSAVQYLPPTPWTLVSFVPHPGSFDFEIKNATKRAQSPLDLGTALFHPNSSALGTSWVTMPRLLLRIGNQTNSLCVVDNEDLHWAIKTMGLPSSGVAGTPPATREITIYPNPAWDEVFVENPNENQVTIVIYDVIGREVWNTNVPASTTSSISMESLPSGSYFLVCHLEGHTETKHITKQ